MWPKLCRLCERPVADGGYLGSELDKEKLAEWCLNFLGTTLADQVDDEDNFCFYCVSDARFLFENEGGVETESSFPNLCWWPDQAAETHIRKLLYTNFKANQVLQCWVPLEKVKASKQDQQSHQIRSRMGMKQSSVECCIYCNQNLSRASLLAHVRLLHADVMLRCNYNANRNCVIFFKTIESRDNHVKEVHLKPKEIKLSDCIYCSKPNLTKSDLYNHIKYYHSKIAIRCTKFKCAQYFFSQAELTRHFEENHVLIGGKEFSCKMCNFKTDQKAHWKNHMDRWHKKTQYVQCPHPNCKSMVRKLNLRAHITSFHKLKKCPFCSLQIGVHSFSKHLMKKLCKTCGDVFVCLGLFNKHQLVCKGKLKILKCDMCPKVFGIRAAITQHILQHLRKQFINHQKPQRPTKYQCKICSNYFPSSRTLRLHFEKMHSTTRKKICCAHCDKRFLNKCSLQNHLSMDHNLIDKSNTCQYCGKNFYLLSNMKSHIQTKHTRESVDSHICGKVILRKRFRNHLAYRHLLF
ncbi:zinc finger protein 317-like [Neocloeon triangulifer]|uniref:zinc finger protein 317-like n=1 Tax=Neocloeon triangulifer TaxID=2078957 RepID=UPI00286F3965|nr:zinc finger protein 317-like [Neocloeon triangulifer]